MHQTLKLTITAVGEPNSIFLVPCDPITLHESEVDENEIDMFDEQEDPREASGFIDSADALAQLGSPRVMVLADHPAMPHRRAS